MAARSGKSTKTKNELRGVNFKQLDASSEGSSSRNKA